MGGPSTTTAFAAVFTTVLLGCPVETAPQGAATPVSAQQPELTEADPRVVRRGEDLYPAKTLERADGLKRNPENVEAASDPPSALAGSELEPQPNTALGSGRADDTNGVCRLYAPELPNPTCCEDNLGFDANLVKEACGLDQYLGESFQSSCGYHFRSKKGAGLWFRLSHLAEDNVSSAVRTHYRQSAMRDAPAAVSIGVDGVVLSRYRGLNWAFFGGWDGAVRLLTWRDGTCSRKGLETMLSRLVAAKKPDDKAKRTLVPSAQY